MNRDFLTIHYKMFHVKHSVKLFVKFIKISTPDAERCQTTAGIKPFARIKKAPQIFEGLFVAILVKLNVLGNNYELIRS